MEFSRPALSRRDFLRLATLEAVAAAACSPSHEQTPTLRSTTEAIWATNRRRFFARFSGYQYPLSPLEKLVDTPLSESSRIGMVNGHIFEEGETTDTGNIHFAFDPAHSTIEAGGQIVPLVANTTKFADFRNDPNAQTRVFDRTIWAMHAGQRVTAVIETDKLDVMGYANGLALLLTLGIRNFIIGNEPNTPNATSADEPNTILKVVYLLRELARSLNISGLKLSSPGLAFYGSGEYLAELTRYCAQHSMPFPFDRIADHYYGSVEEVLPRIDLQTSNLARLGLGGKPFDFPEVNKPENESLTDQQLAEGFIPQVFSQIFSSEKVSRVSVYSAFDGIKPDYSLAMAEKNRLTPKASYKAYSVVGKLFTRAVSSTINNKESYIEIPVQRSDGIKFREVWARKKDMKLTIGKDELAFTATGEPIQHNGSIDLYKQENDCLGGSCVYILNP